MKLLEYVKTQEHLGQQRSRGWKIKHKNGDEEDENEEMGARQYPVMDADEIKRR